MRTARYSMSIILVLTLSGCELLDWDMLFGDDSLVPVEYTSTATALAHESILLARPMASRYLLGQLERLLPGSSASSSLLREVEERLLLPLFDSSQPDMCPYLTPSGTGSSLRCNTLTDLAVKASSLSSRLLASDALSQVVGSHSLTNGEMGFVAAWTNQAVQSGIESGAIMAVDLMRTFSLCDGSPDQRERAFMAGEAQGRALLDATALEVLPLVPPGQCNTDIVAATVLAEARRRSSEPGRSQALCAGVPSAQLVEPVDLAALEPQRLAGVSQGLERGHEVLRVQLVHSWECDPDQVENLEPCHCYARYSGGGPVYCFYESDFDSFPPRSGTVLDRMAASGTPQCYGDNRTASPVGSPLVLDLDDDGINLSRSETVRFDLSGSGEPVWISAMTGGDAFLALDLNGDGVIDSGRELFGNYSPCGDGYCIDGVEALAYHDSNGDGVIDEEDPVYSRLLIWRDLNLDGRSQPWELQDLASAGIVSISLEPRMDLAWVDGRGNSAMRALSFTRTDGRVGVMHDVWFAVTLDQLSVNFSPTYGR